MQTGDLMLSWMSEMGSGSVRALRDSLDWVSRDPHGHSARKEAGRWLRDLSSLGHAEVGWDQDRWAIAPVALYRLPEAGGLAVLAGSRRGGVVELLEQHMVVVEVPNDQASGIPLPTTILLQYDSVEELPRVATVVGGVYAGCAARRLAKRLRPHTLRDRCAPPVFGGAEGVEWLLGDGRRWELVDGVRGEGLYRLRINGRQRYRYMYGEHWYRSDLAAGQQIEHARQGREIMRWRPDGGEKPTGGTLFVDWGAPLTPLQARALVLCSGLGPRAHGSAYTLEFTNVPSDVAALVAQSARTTLAIMKPI